MKGINTLLVIQFAFAANSLAHVGLDRPEGGERFEPGEQVVVQWHIEIEHVQENWDLHFSSDGGETWEPLQLDMPVEQLEYTWTIPDITTDKGRLKIEQDNVDYFDYYDVSLFFGIGLQPGEDVITSVDGDDLSGGIHFTVWPNPSGVETNFHFYLPDPEIVSLEIFDALGKKAEVLISEQKLLPGDRRIAWQSAEGKEGIYFCRLTVGETVLVRKLVIRR